MAEKITLNKEVYSPQAFKNTINTSFSQLVTVAPTASITSVFEPTVSVQEFFSYYKELFFLIPKVGSVNSHEYLIKTSTDYVGYNPVDSEMQAVIEEITQLRQENLDLQKQIYSLQNQIINNVTGSL